jgi:hypothetical protein
MRSRCREITHGLTASGHVISTGVWIRGICPGGRIDGVLGKPSRAASACGRLCAQDTDNTTPTITPMTTIAVRTPSDWTAPERALLPPEWSYAHQGGSDAALLRCMSPQLAHHVDPWIGRQVRSGRVTGLSCEIGGCPPVRHRAGSQAIADLPIGARGGLRHHRATAKEYCPSSSTVARQRTPGHDERPPGSRSCSVAFRVTFIPSARGVSLSRYIIPKSSSVVLLRRLSSRAPGLFPSLRVDPVEE